MTSTLASAIYPGRVTHLRRRPQRHFLDYRIYSLLLDLEELGTLDRRLWLFSLNRFNIFSFYAGDRGNGTGEALRLQIERSMTAVGIVPDGGAIRLLTMPRVLGWSFNPLSIFFCYRRSGEVAAILWEVDNTYGERHGYMIPVEQTQSGEIRQTCAKGHYVSPFLDMDLDYVFKVRPPENKFSIVIEARDSEGPMLTACHVGRRVALTDGALLKVFFSIPLLTLRVVGGIHWEALKLWIKGIGLRTHPCPPDTPVTFVVSHSPKPEVSRS